MARETLGVGVMHKNHDSLMTATTKLANDKASKAGGYSRGQEKAMKITVGSTAVAAETDADVAKKIEEEINSEVLQMDIEAFF